MYVLDNNFWNISDDIDCKTTKWNSVYGCTILREICSFTRQSTISDDATWVQGNKSVLFNYLTKSKDQDKYWEYVNISKSRYFVKFQNKFSK